MLKPILAATLLALSLNLYAAKDEHAGHAMPTDAVEATVKKIDAASGKVTLAHGPLKSLGMPAMTMVFKAKDAKSLAALKEGDKVRFVAEMAGNDYLASKIEKLK